MATNQLSLHHLVRFPTSIHSQDTQSCHPTILALHGRGSNESDLIGLAPHLPDRLLWVSLRAPLVLGPDSYEWYRVRVIGIPDSDKVMSALETIDRFVDEILSTYPIEPKKLFLLGFSQGSFLSMCYALNHPSRIAGVIAQSGYIPNNIDLEIKEAELKDKPFILTHGEQDILIPIEWARASRNRLQKLGVDLTYHEFQMGHQVSVESLAVISEWLQNILNSRSGLSQIPP
jgi:phospholipase/carboxylesterase